MAKKLEPNATLTKWEAMTPSLAVFTVRPDAPYPAFIPGQYTTLGVNHEAKGSVSRAYSIASAPEEGAEQLEFYVRRVSEPKSDVPLTHLLFGLKEGDRVWMAPKARGHFNVPHCVGEDDPRLKVFVAAGTGLAPFRSIVRSHILRTGRVDERHVIAHGASYLTDLGYRDELEAAMNVEGRTRYIPTLSRPDASWTGTKGRVESLFAGDGLAEFERRLGLAAGELRPENAVVFICGLQGTIANTLLSLLDRGFVPDETKIRHALWIPQDTRGSLFFEQYDSEPIIDTKSEEVCAAARERLEKAGVRLQQPEPMPT